MYWLHSLLLGFGDQTRNGIQHNHPEINYGLFQGQVWNINMETWIVLLLLLLAAAPVVVVIVVVVVEEDDTLALN